MYVHVENVTAKRSGTRTQAVICEKCGTNFWYELTRVGVGNGSAVYGLFKEATKRRAEAAAEKNLQKRLAREAELVPCPKCRWVNQELVQKARNTYYRQAHLLVLAIAAIGVAIGWIAVYEYESSRYEVPSQVMEIVAAVVALCLLSPVWVLFIRRQLRRRLDPNRSYPNSPPPPPGTPPALIEVVDPQSGKAYLQAAPGAATPQYQSGQWAILRPGQLIFPRVCCVCMEESQTVYKMPLKVDNDSEIGAPLCRPCLGRLRRRWLMVLLDSTALAFGVGYAIAFSIHGIDDVGRWILAGVMAFVGAIVGVVIASNLFCRPYRLRIVDRDRGIMRFKAANPHFTQLLIDNARAADGVAVD